MCVSVASRSVTCSVMMLPDDVSVTSSVTEPVITEISGASFVPVIVIVSVSFTVAPCSSVVVMRNVSVSVSPSARAWTRGSSFARSYLYVPFSLIVTVPYSPFVALPTFAALPSTSAIVRVWPLSMSSSLARILPSEVVWPSVVDVLSSSTTEPALSFAVGASFVPCTVMVMFCVVSPPCPSLTVTEKTSS